MSDPSEEIKLTETNIESINRDAEKLRNVNKQITSSEANDDDVDDGLSNYTDVQVRLWLHIIISHILKQF